LISRVLLFVLAVALLAAPLSADTITLLNGTKIEGVRILGETHTEISYRKPRVNAPQTAKTSEVASITYSSTSADYREGQTKLAEGNLVDAASYFYAAAQDEDNTPHLRAKAMIEAADLLELTRNLDDAIPVYDELLKTFPDTRHLARALVGRGKALLYKGEVAAAEAAFAKLLSEAEAKGLGERWEMEGEYYALYVTEAKGDSKTAVKGYEALRSRARADWPGIANKCALRIGRVHLASDDANKAMPLFETIIDGRLETEADIVANAYNGRGRCHFAIAQSYLATADKHAASGVSDKATVARQDAVDSFREARLDFLRVVVQYTPVLDQQPEALYWAAQCFLNVDDDDAQRQAGRLLRKCALEYPNSKWGKLAGQN
jgi:tetratricopeptide (TPR) repeat protein